jgi:hypothetical protein
MGGFHPPSAHIFQKQHPEIVSGFTNTKIPNIMKTLIPFCKKVFNFLFVAECGGTPPPPPIHPFPFTYNVPPPPPPRESKRPPSRMIVAYIAHPIGGDVAANIEKVKRIIHDIMITRPHVVPFAHYMVDLMVLDDNNPQERQRGIDNDHELMRRGFIDELWLYGDHISRGMADEIDLAIQHNIPVLPQTRETFEDYSQRWGDDPPDDVVDNYHCIEGCRRQHDGTIKHDVDCPSHPSSRVERETDDECDVLMDLVGAPPERDGVLPNPHQQLYLHFNDGRPPIALGDPYVIGRIKPPMEHVVGSWPISHDHGKTWTMDVNLINADQLNELVDKIKRKRKRQSKPTIDALFQGKHKCHCKPGESTGCTTFHLCHVCGGDAVEHIKK